ncbi:MAG: phosphate/phosphite/phosphonate ABC transporter substrate-binding protein [Thermodesulfovibrionales bacterium]|nr:phosphate/phosphite/phosphonate ABC transporter substrate-binding protein [Thermodesulfovibrionales bacterium]
MKKFALLALMLLFVLTIPITSIAAELKFGLLPRLSEKEMIDGFTPLAQYLEKELGVKVKLVVPKDFETWTNEAKAGAYDIAYTNPYLYVVVKKAVKDAQAIAIASEPEIGTKLYGTIIVKKDSPIKSISDLKGKTIAATDPGSAGAYLVQMLMLQKANLKKDDVKIIFEKRRDPVADAVLAGKADAGFVRDDDVEKLKAGGDKFRRLGKSDPIPNWVVFTGKKIDSNMATKIKNAVLKLKPGDLQSIKVLAPARTDGFVPATDKDFNIMIDAAKAAGAY